MTTLLPASDSVPFATASRGDCAATTAPSFATDNGRPAHNSQSVASTVSYLLPATLACDIESVIADSQDARLSAAAIRSVVELMHHTLAWIHETDRSHHELVSFAEVVQAALAHQARMAGFAEGGHR